MNRPERAAALLIAALVLSGCAASSAPDPGEASEAPTPAASPAASEAPASEAPAESSEPQADSADDTLRRQCEMVVQERFVADSPRLATDQDYAGTADSIGFALPSEPTCGVVYVPEGGGTFTLHVYVDQPEVAAALADGFSDSGWSKTQEQGAGYVSDVYADGDVTAGISPIGVDNPASAWGGLWSGMDVTLFGVEQP